jgi:hypothetical protein
MRECWYRRDKGFYEESGKILDREEGRRVFSNVKS